MQLPHLAAATAALFSTTTAAFPHTAPPRAPWHVTNCVLEGTDDAVYYSFDVAGHAITHAHAFSASCSGSGDYPDGEAQYYPCSSTQHNETIFAALTDRGREGQTLFVQRRYEVRGVGYTQTGTFKGALPANFTIEPGKPKMG